MFEEPVNTHLKRLVDEALTEHRKLAISAINWCEIYYVAYRKAGKIQAERLLKSPASLNVAIIHTDETVVIEASRLKVSYPGLAIADCFVAALAKVMNKRLITCDRDFVGLGRQVKLSFIRM